MPDLFYLQDSRSYVGNDMLFWAKNGSGYTTDLRQAEIYSREQAQAQHDSRSTDIPWPKGYIDAKTRPAVDVQYVKRNEALAGTGITLTPEPKPRKDQYRCTGCGIFMSEHDFWVDKCKRCGEDNRP